MSNNWLSTVCLTVTWMCPCGASHMTGMGNSSEQQCRDCGRTWHVNTRLTISYDDPPKAAEPAQAGPSLWQATEAVPA